MGSAKEVCMQKKMQVGFRSPVRCEVYRQALQPRGIGCVGFIIGTAETFTRPIFDTALVSEVVYQGDSYAAPIRRLVSQLAICADIADYAEAKLLGIFVAKEGFDSGWNFEQFGIAIDVAREINLPYLVIFPMDGYESCWQASVWNVNWFPHDRLPIKALCRRSSEPKHNPRRIKKVWKAALAEWRLVQQDACDRSGGMCIMDCVKARNM